MPTRAGANPRTGALLLAALGAALLGMGSFGGGHEAGMPVREFRATLTDIDGAHFEVSRLTVGSDTQLEGDLGRGRLRVPFDNITRIRVEPADKDRVRAEVTLRDGEPVVVFLRGSITFYGQRAGGAYQIRARDLASIDFAAR